MFKFISPQFKCLFFDCKNGTNDFFRRCILHTFHTYDYISSKMNDIVLATNSNGNGHMSTTYNY
jgi:hypothetical protein